MTSRKPSRRKKSPANFDFFGCVHEELAKTFRTHSLEVVSESFLEQTLYLGNYANGTSGLRVEFEPATYSLTVFLVRLRDGKFPAARGRITPQAPIDFIDLETLAEVQGTSLPSLALKTSPSVRDLLQRSARLLEATAGGVLRGEFSSFEAAERVTRDRAREFDIRHLGEEGARKLGWK